MEVSKYYLFRMEKSSYNANHGVDAEGIWITLESLIDCMAVGTNMERGSDADYELRGSIFSTHTQAWILVIGIRYSNVKVPVALASPCGLQWILIENWPNMVASHTTKLETIYAEEDSSTSQTESEDKYIRNDNGRTKTPFSPWRYKRFRFLRTANFVEDWKFILRVLLSLSITAQWIDKIVTISNLYDTQSICIGMFVWRIRAFMGMLVYMCCTVEGA